MVEEIKELISRRRRQIMIHSCIYYRFGTSLVSDKQFDEWAYELVALQETYPELALSCPLAKDFEGFDGTTGFYLGQPEWVLKKARYLIENNKESEVV